jgi:hypothetical protein
MLLDAQVALLEKGGFSLPVSPDLHHILDENMYMSTRM